MLKKEDQKHYLGHRSRLKERLRRDSRALADYEVLELLVSYANPRRDAKPLAKALLARFGSLRGVYQANPAELLAVEGANAGLESFWTLWREFLARLGEQDVAERVQVDSPEVVANLARERLGALAGEEFWVLLVDAGNRVMGWERLSQGGANQSPVSPRDVVALALRRQAAGIVLVHNHPSGETRPSPADQEVTRLVGMAAHGVNLKVLDHVIVAGKKWSSLKKLGMM
ncbi:hypothetical protein NNJEOMEG_03963 [Fundidesulfovibrio magnetotacticus]|uniref:MPN domain-containing protein n=1 Tax=Fundidesulfovibrio magnetotacticus TaxID=2730080 RepID=A0A6V8M1K6_9BACT|nr:DNA repair protein RadC [Fundidesulfovibrio magnetotacticus]GFK96089.1 hypothetical protein NNJEOMEG_03963 [Fundidesulfovibrio magnetotacticus]